MAPCAIGIDIGGTHLRAAVVSAEGSILRRARLTSSHDPAEVLARCLALIADVRGPDVSAIGVGVPGQVDAATRAVLSGGYVDLSGFDFARQLEAGAGLPVTLENDAAMALLGEAAVGAARGISNAVMLTIGTGIGGAVLEGGHLLRGKGVAGQLGHIVIDPQGRHCVCGRIGCVETVSSGTAFGMHLAEAGLPLATRAQDLLARPDDPVSLGVLRAWAVPLQAAIDTLVAVCNPQMVVIGGGAGDGAVAALAQIAPRPSWFAAQVVAAQLGDDAGVVGAAFAAMRVAKPKRLVMINGVPASGKSGVAHALATTTGWPILALDTIKAPFLIELAPVDRPFNRTLGRATYAAMFDVMRDAPAGSTFIMDAWFGFQPPEVLTDGLARAGVTEVVEIWCHAPPEVIGARYAARATTRLPGHPGADYVPELIALAAQAQPSGIGPVWQVDTTQLLDTTAIARWLGSVWS